MKKSDAGWVHAVGALGVIQRSFVLLALSAATTVWAGPNVNVLATDLIDVTAGEDLWSYEYTIAGPLGSFEGINLLFSSTSYGADLSVISSDASLSPLVTPPILVPATDGLISVTAVDPLAAGSSAHLSVQFVWLAAGTPGAQPFEVMDDQFNVVATGMTSAVPEVSSAALLFAGLILLTPLALRRNRH